VTAATESRRVGATPGPRPPVCELCGGTLVHQAGPYGWVGCDCCGMTQPAGGAR
jgi:hypothetical protein